MRYCISFSFRFSWSFFFKFSMKVYYFGKSYKWSRRFLFPIPKKKKKITEKGIKRIETNLIIWAVFISNKIYSWFNICVWFIYSDSTSRHIVIFSIIQYSRYRSFFIYALISWTISSVFLFSIFGVCLVWRLSLWVVTISVFCMLRMLLLGF